MAIWIKNFPLPPSQNTANIPIVGKMAISKKTGKKYYKARVIKSKEHDHFYQMCRIWAIQNKTAMTQIKEYLKRYQEECEAKGETFALKIDFYFVFHVERVLTLKNQAQELDTDNRLKPCSDGLKMVLGLDDRYYFTEHCEKVTTTTKDLECTIIKISKMRPRNLQQILSLTTENTPAS